MEEKDKKQNTVTCPNCGEQCSVRRKFCASCGAVLRPDKEREETKQPAADTEQLAPEHSTPEAPAAEQSAPEPAPEQPAPEQPTPDEQPIQAIRGADAHAEGTCPNCGGRVRRSDRFCALCGAAVTKKCGYCGASGKAGDKFCSACGTPFDAADTGVYAAADGSASDEKVAARRKRGQRLRTIGLILSGAGLLFLFLPFLSAYGNGVKYDTICMALIAAMAGNVGSGIGVGILPKTLMISGWAALLYIVGAALALMTALLNRARPYKVAKPFGELMPAIIQLASGGVLAVTSTSAAVNVVELGGSVYYIGGIIPMLLAISGFALTLTAVIYRRGAYPKAAPKFNAQRIVNFAVSVALTAAAVLIALVPFAASTNMHRAVISPNERGTDIVWATTGVSYYDVGVCTYRLDGLSADTAYSFEIKLTDNNTSGSLENVIALCYYEDIVDKSEEEIFRVRAIMTNQTDGGSTAKLTFVNTYDRPLAVVVRFAADNVMGISYDYCFRVRKSSE